MLICDDKNCSYLISKFSRFIIVISCSIKACCMRCINEQLYILQTQINLRVFVKVMIMLQFIIVKSSHELQSV